MRKELDQKILSIRSEKLNALCGKEFATRLRAYVKLYAEEEIA